MDPTFPLYNVIARTGQCEQRNQLLRTVYVNHNTQESDRDVYFQIIHCRGYKLNNSRSFRVNMAKKKKETDEFELPDDQKKPLMIGSG